MGVHAGLRLVFVCRVRLNRHGAAIGVSAQAENLHLVSHAFAVVAAILLLSGGKAGTGHIRAFLGTKHSPPLPVQPLQPLSGGWQQDADTDDEIVAQLAGTYEENRRKISKGGMKPFGWAETRCVCSNAAAAGGLGPSPLGRG
jgi:hypothetical protein